MAFASPALAGSILFDFDYSGNTAGVGFLNSTSGATRQAAMTKAGNLFSDMFGKYFSNSGTIKLAVTSSDNSSTNTLASAGSELVFPSGTPGYIGEVVKTKLQTGNDLNGNNADGSVDVNWAWNWHLDSDTPVLGSEYDFYSTIFHEFTHVLGFLSLIEEDGNPIAAKQWSTFDHLMVDKDGNKIIDPTTFNLNQTAWNSASIGGTGNGVFFAGDSAKAANSGNPVNLYSPTTWSDGSSVSHLDYALFPSAMMRHASDMGPEARDYNPVEVGIMTDIGYSRNVAAPVPEPASMALMLTGMGVFGWRIRRRK